MQNKTTNQYNQQYTTLLDGKEKFHSISPVATDLHSSSCVIFTPLHVSVPREWLLDSQPPIETIFLWDQ